MRYGAAATAVTVAVLSLILALLMGGQGRLEAGLALPRVSPVPEITATPTPARLKVTAAPTPIRVQVERHYPPAAVDLVADGRVLFTMADPQAARDALERYLKEAAGLGLGPDQRLIRAGFDQTLTLEEPSGKGELLTVEEAVNTLMADEGLLPVARTVVRCVIDRSEIETVARDNPLLVKGSRVYRTLGSAQYLLSYYETVYRGQAAFSETRTNEFTVGQVRTPRAIEDGGYDLESASPQAGPKAAALEGLKLAWPVDGTVTESFGMTAWDVHYSVDVAAESVARVMAPEGGVVVYCGQRGELGLVIDILHDDTGALSRIIGCQRALVELYQRVKKGEQVGVLPEPVTGRLVTLRYELLINGLPVNPEKYLPKK